ncbi:MAG: flagellar motor switch protein FliN [Balneolaceae bacterium]|nr:flagellar motor switch protein FliN [Balneolaceae bacterium]
MELTHWTQGAESHLPALEAFFKQVLLKKCKVELSGSDELDNDAAADFLKESEFLVRTAEENFQSEILFGFGEAWGPLLARQILNSDEEVSDEITSELVREMIENLVGMVTASLREVAIELEVSDIEGIKKGQVKRSLNIQEYYSASYEISPKFDLEGEEAPEPLTMRLVVSAPDTDRVELIEAHLADENPFEDDTYAELCAARAGAVEIRRAEDATNGEAAPGLKVEGQNVEFEQFDRKSGTRNDREVRNIDILKDVELDLSVELGRREMPLGKVLQLVKGSVIELEKLAGEPVEILVNGHMIAQGDVVVIDEHFGVRISKLHATQERLKGLS